MTLYAVTVVTRPKPSLLLLSVNASSSGAVMSSARNAARKLSRAFACSATLRACLSFFIVYFSERDK